MSDLFTTPEINLMCIFDTSSRETLIAEIIDATAHFEDEEMIELAVAVLDRLSKMSDEDFAALELYPVFEEYDEQEV